MYFRTQEPKCHCQGDQPQRQCNNKKMGSMRDRSSRQGSSDKAALAWSYFRKDLQSLEEVTFRPRSSGIPIRHGQPSSPPLTESAMLAREQQNLQHHQERKAWRSARVTTITNQWVNSRTNKGGPKAEDDRWSFDNLLCCCMG